MTTPTAPNAEKGQKFRISGLYVKDISFENPLAPGIFVNKIDKPDMNVGVDVNLGKLKENAYEVALRVHARAEASDSKALFLVELVYAGLFIVNPELPEAEHEKILLVDCAAVIFPFARRLIADLVKEGGFPPLILEPLNFEAIYNSKRQKAA